MSCVRVEVNIELFNETGPILLIGGWLEPLQWLVWSVGLVSATLQGQNENNNNN